MEQKFLSALSIFLLLFLISCADEKTIYQISDDNSSKGTIITIASRFDSDIRCEYGGISIKSGIDNNINGLLEDDEVLDTKFICDEKSPTEPPVKDTQLITAEQEPAGANCKEGGVAVKIGLDTNKNEILDPEEVKSTHYICNGETPEPPEPPEPPEEKFGKMLVYQNPAKPSNICSIDNVTIYNTGTAPLIVAVQTNENTAFINRKEYTTMGSPNMPPMLPPSPQPFYIVPNGYKDISFNMQPLSEGVVPVEYRLISDNPRDEVFIRSDNCTVVSAAGKAFNDIISDDTIFITSEYNKIQGIAYSRVCKAGSNCYIGLPQGVKIGTYPIEIKVDWGNGISETTKVTKITSAESYLFKNIYDEQGEQTINIGVKTADMVDFVSGSFSVEVN